MINKITTLWRTFASKYLGAKYKYFKVSPEMFKDLQYQISIDVAQTRDRQVFALFKDGSLIEYSTDGNKISL